MEGWEVENSYYYECFFSHLLCSQINKNINLNWLSKHNKYKNKIPQKQINTYLNIHFFGNHINITHFYIPFISIKYINFSHKIINSLLVGKSL